MSDLHPIDEAAMQRVEGRERRFDWSKLGRVRFVLTDEDRARSLTLRAWCSSPDIDAGPHQRLDRFSDHEIDAFDGRLIVWAGRLVYDPDSDGPHGDKAAAIHEGELGGEVDGQLHERGHDGALFGKFLFKGGHRLVSGVKRLIKALWAGVCR